MSRIDIDFAAPGLRRTLFHVHPAVWVVAALGLLLCAGAASTGYRLVSQRHEREAHLRYLSERQAARARLPAATGAKVAIPEAQAAAVNAAVLQLNLPWRALQEAVAAATPPTVALLSLEPDARKQVLRVSAEVKTSDDMVAYIEELKQQEFFSAVVLTRHEIMELDPNRPIRFQFEATWAAR